MWIFIVLFMLVPMVIALIVYRIVRSSRNGPSPMAEGMFKGMGIPSGENMYTMMFPDIAPVFQPPGLLEWFAWYKERKKSGQLLRDGRRWHGEVPGFSGAAIMSAKGEDETDLVVLQNSNGQTLAAMTVETLPDGSGKITVSAGTFLLTPDAPGSKVRFDGQGRYFEWSGIGQWKLQSPTAQHGVETHGEDSGLSMGDVATGAVAGAIAQKVIDGRASQRTSAAPPASPATDAGACIRCPSICWRGPSPASCR